MKRYKLNGTYFYCPVDLTLSVIGGRWKGLVIWNLKNEEKRYGELKKLLIGINDKMLSQILKEFESKGIINRILDNSNPQKITYSLTEQGKEILPMMYLMSKWGDKYEI